MPEGPEIIITSQYLKSKIKKKKIKRVEIVSGRYTHETLKGYELTENNIFIVEDIDTKGKFLWFKMKDLSGSGKTYYMLNTFGLSGRWSFENNKNARVKFTIQSNSDTNKTYSLYYIDPRNFGTIEFTDNETNLNNKLNKLAPDILKDIKTDEEIVKKINHIIANKKKKDLNLVKTLMDQEILVSGIGNYLVAEILYDACLDPHRSLVSLNDSEIKKLAQSMRKIPKYAYYDNGSGYMEYFDTFMKSHTDKIDKGVYPNYHPDIKVSIGFKFKVYQQKKDPNGYVVLNDEIVKGRTIHWVKEIQK